MSSGQPAVVCEHGHYVVSSIAVPCECGGHDRFVCRMRLGNRPCGWSVLVPPVSDDCGKDE
jgi:hypothetical protein